MSEKPEKLRLDKWLWAARFFKTRTLAKSAIEGGKVHFDGRRVKVSKDIQVGDELRIRQGLDDKYIVVKALSDRRQGAPIAQALYEETQASIADRQVKAELRKQLNLRVPQARPDKKERRQLNKIKHLSEW